MSGLKKIKWKHYINYIAVAAFTLLFTILSFSGALKSSDLYLLEKIAISVILATSLSMVVGFLGELSLGHAGFMCVGAYLGGKVSVILEPTLGEIPTLIISLLVGGVVAGICGLIWMNVCRITARSPSCGGGSRPFGRYFGGCSRKWCGSAWKRGW